MSSSGPLVAFGATPYHAAYWAHALTVQGEAGTVDSLGRSLASARVDLNPHQVDAALFALRSPLSKGALLADEVGLGKTIEAGLVLAQRWAERRRRLLLVVPATLRRQWQEELASKFGLPSRIFDAKVYRQLVKDCEVDPVDSTEAITICSYHYAASQAERFQAIPWDLVVIDEAHRLRNVYRASNTMANAIKFALEGRQKLLLTATPLQNSLLELYGLVSIIDPHVFGDLASFKEQFTRAVLPDQVRNAELRSRLQRVAVRALRSQVAEYVRFTSRFPLTQEFYASDEEHRLYESLSSWLQRPHLEALPTGQRTLLTLVLRKLLASSPTAVAGTLERMVRRLEELVADPTRLGFDGPLVDEDDLEDINELAEELDEDRPAEGLEVAHATPGAPATTTRSPEERAKGLAREVRELRAFIAMAHGVAHDAKAAALLSALQTAFRETERLGAARKAVVFTESRRTQQYLVSLLEQNGYGDQVVALSGTSTDPASREIYQRWLNRHPDEGGRNSSRGADIKAAVVEEFRDNATILVATESAGEGVNLQFCSLVVNYDLPWNPQRVEQRIGRCHRYGQAHDVVVLNFVNLRNAADKRVYELLSEKFRLFEGVFGASDEVLGALESGVDIERRIAWVYQECRTPEEIQEGFDRLQAELENEIAARMSATREAVLDHFDDEVQQRLQVHRDQALGTLNTRQRWLVELSRFTLGDAARFDAIRPRFEYAGRAAPAGWYNLDWRDAEHRGENFYHQDHSLAQRILAGTLAQELREGSVRFDLSSGRSPVAALQPYLGRAGWLSCSRLTLSATDVEEHIVVTAVSDDGVTLPDDLAARLFSLAGTAEAQRPGSPPSSLHIATDTAVQRVAAESASRREAWLRDESEKLERWADDLRTGVERELKELDRAISEARRESLSAVTLEDKLTAQRELQGLSRARSRKRAELFEAQDAIDERRDGMIADLEIAIRAESATTSIFTIRWELV